jgi:putative tryptophan/tyrosine transport system ATP-binding protein
VKQENRAENALLEVEKATVVFNKGQSSQVRALDELSLSVAEGDYVTIVGSNGAGKSTLLNLVAGSVAAQSRCLRFEGRDITGVPDFRRAAFIARVFQNPLAGTSPAMSVEENLALAHARGRRRGLRLAVTRSRRELFRGEVMRVGLRLEDRLTQMASVLSGGERQSLTVIMATLEKPRILLLDEHTAALDPRTERQVMQLTDTLIREQQLTTLMVTHNLEHALNYGNRMIMMHRGKVLIELDEKEKSSMDVHGALDLFHKQDAMLADAVLMGTGRPTEGRPSVD